MDPRNIGAIMFKDIIKTDNINVFISTLSNYKCNRCSLSLHDNKVVVYRGNPSAQIMLIGEAPGLVEDQQGKAFVGPAGVLMEKIFASVGINMDKDVYSSNICRCRPVAKENSGKQNYTPLAEQRTNCMHYLKKEIELINPKIIIGAGGTALRMLLEEKAQPNMNKLAGRFLSPLRKTQTGIGRDIFALYHPAWIIHSQKRGVESALYARHSMWNHINVLRN